MLDSALLWIAAGGAMEPLWVIGLKKYDERPGIPWALFAAFFLLMSPVCMSFAMETMPMGETYAIWTGLGAVFTMIAGSALFKEKIGRMRVAMVFLIVMGVAGLQLCAGGGT